MKFPRQDHAARQAALLLTLCAAAAPTGALAGTAAWSFSSGVDYTQGDYGTGQDTSIVVAPFSAIYGAERWRAALTVTYASIDGAGGVVPGSSSAIGAGSPLSNVVNPLLGAGGPAEIPIVATDVEEQGLGDTTLELGFTPYIGENGAHVSLSGAVRLPTGDEERSLGAGETVVSFAAGAAQSIADRGAIYGAVGYAHAVESGDGGVFLSGGVEGRVNDDWLLGASAEWSESRVAGAPERTQVTLYSGFSLSTDVLLAAYVVTGLSDAAPDTGGGIRLTLH
ncbi:MAG: hypothetical protein ACREH4_02075 [Vitreimonas sp.]